MRSPAWETSASASPPSSNRSNGSAGIASPNAAAVATLASTAPASPAQVLLGDTRGISFGPPISRPAR